MATPGKVNCWEAKACGREPGGARTAGLGVCPAATEKRLAGLNGGVNGGRACWGITGTLCEGKVQGTYAAKAVSCLACDFFQRVARDEGRALTGLHQIRDRLHTPT